MDKATSFSLKTDRNWYLVDAKKDNLGRIASKVSRLLQGKHKAEFSPQLDSGDFVVIVNTKYLKVSHPSKWKNKIYYHHTGYPGGIKDETLKEAFDKDPSEIVRRAVYRMLPKNKLRSGRIKRLKLFPDEEKGKKLYKDMKNKPVQKKTNKVSKKSGKEK